MTFLKLYKMGQKVRPQTVLMAITLSNLNRFYKKNFSGRFLGEFAVKWLLKVAPHLAYFATLLCEILNAENKRLTINYKVIFKVRWGC